MFYGKPKKIIVLNDINSNLFESAILVLKEEKKKEDKTGVLHSNKGKNSKEDFILKEAESIISNYIKENKCKLAIPKNMQDSNSRFMKNIIINSALIGSAVAVVFLLLQLF